MPLASRAGLWNLTVEAGATFTERATPSGTPWDLTNYSARAMARVTYPATSTLFSLTDGAGITLGGAAGWVQVDLTSEQTTAIGEALAFVEATVVWDLELVLDGSDPEDVTRFAQGVVTVSPEATRVDAP